jgi:phospholipid/cholesterol/gamma-HCH transport system substrate-binding protein
MKNKGAKVGLFVLIGLLIFSSGLVLIGSMRKLFVSKIQATATFNDVSGLSKGNNVTYAGVKVGTVESLSFTPNQGVKVTFGITENSQEFIYKDAIIKVSTDGLIGNPLLVITGGSPQRGAIADGHIFSVSKEDSQQDMLKTFQESNKNILAITSDVKVIVDEIKNGKGSLGKILKDEKIYENLDQTLAKLNASASQVGVMANNMTEFSKGLTDKNTLPYQLTRNTTIMPQLTQTSSKLVETSVSFKQTADETNAMIKDLNKNINSLLSDQNSPLGVVTKDDKAAENIRNTISNLASSSSKLSENMEALQHNIFFRRYFRKKEKENSNEK